MLTTGLSGDGVALRDVIALSAPPVQVQTCPAPDFVVDLLLLFPERPSVIKRTQNL